MATKCVANRLPSELANIEHVSTFPSHVFRWHTNEEIAAYLLSQESHREWLIDAIPERPGNGSLFIYSRNKIPRFTSDGHEWKKRRDGRTTREDHMKLKVRSLECLNAVYAHSATISTFHRRRYWLLQKPGIVFVHYLDMNYEKKTQNVFQPSQPAGAIPVYQTDCIARSQPVSMLTEDTGLVLPSHPCTELNRYSFIELSGLLQNSSVDESIQDSGYGEMTNDWPVNGEMVTVSKMMSETSESSQNVLDEKLNGELTNGEDSVSLLSPIESAAGVPCESPYSELLHWLGSSGSSPDGLPDVLNKDNCELTDSHPAVLEGMEVSPSADVVDHIPDEATKTLQTTLSLPSLSSEVMTYSYSQQQQYNVPSITDFSPDWSYLEGGVKVLVIGPWLSAKENYMCMFDGHAVPAAFLQDGVLRCFCPAHEPGLVSLRVAYGNVISSCAVFEYKTCPPIASSTDVIPGDRPAVGIINPLISISPASSQGSMQLAVCPQTDVVISRQDECLSGMGRLSPLSSPFEQFRPPQSPQDTVYSSPGASPGSSLSTQSIDGGEATPTVVDWCEFLGDSKNVLEQDFTDLSLTEHEQQELYRAARKIQMCFRKYKASREKAAAIQIQNFYRRYRETQRMNKAAALIQSQYRTYKHHLRVRRAATVIQQGYRHYSQRKRQRFMQES